jgi:hypothetical protein
MKFPRFVPKEALPQLELEQPSVDLRTFFTRVLRDSCSPGDAVSLIRMNDLINRARTIQGKKIFVLDADDWGDYPPAYYAWHQGEFELILRGLTTVEFVEFIAELVEQEYLARNWVNRYFEEDNLAVRIEAMSGGELSVEVLPLAELKELASDKDQPRWHDNIRLLLDRMEDAKKNGDHAGLLHAGASIFETLAKQVIGIESVQDQTLGGIFERYRKDSNLPAPILDYIKALYDRRNTTPLAGHGSLSTPPNLSEEEAVTLIETTKAFVRIEYRLRLASEKIEAPPVAARKTKKTASGAGQVKTAPASPEVPVAAPPVHHDTLPVTEGADGTEQSVTGAAKR